MFKEKFDYVDDEDFADHTPAEQDDIHEFLYGCSSGPDIDDLHLDCRRGKGSDWNKKVVELLIDELMIRVKEDADRRWPDVPYELAEELVWKRAQCLMTVWREAQPTVGICIW